MRSAALAALIALAVLLAGCGGRSDSSVQSDLHGLLLAHGYGATIDSCTHQNGNNYICKVKITSPVLLAGTRFLQVTDDGHSIYEQGIG